MPKAEPVEHVVCGGRLQIGGRWYFNGQRVRLNPKDAEIYAARGLTRPLPADPERQPSAAVETIPPQQVGIVTKDEPPANVDLAVPNQPKADTLEPKPTPAPTPAPEPSKEPINGKQSRKPNR